MAALSAAIVLVLVGNGLVIAEAIGSRRAPAFSEGGEFLGVAPAAASTTVPVRAASDSGTTTSSPPVVTVTRGSTTTVSQPAPTTSTAPAVPPEPPPPLRPPAPGVYMFAVVGTESASIVGSRAFESQLTVVVHGAAGLGPDQVVLDYTFSSQHEEREIATYGADGVSLVNEGGSVTFGLLTEASEASFDPPMGQVPAPLAPGATRSGTSAARSPAGTVLRVDDWETRVTGREPVVVAGQAIDTWVVQFARRSRPGDEVITQRMTLWFDPLRRISVKIEDEIHADRVKGILTLTYDARYTATLSA